MDANQIWELAEDALVPLNAMRGRAIQPFLDETGLDGSTYVLLALVLANEPAPAPIGELRKVSPYTSLQRFTALLDGAVDGGLLERSTATAYRLTDTGRRHVAGVLARSQAFFSRCSTLDVLDAERLSGLLGRVVGAALAAPLPREPWFTLQVRKLAPASGPVSAAVEFLSCLQAYRSDTHAAAWDRWRITPLAAEMMTLLWRESVISKAALHERLEGPGHRRGHPLEDYEAAVTELRHRSLVDGPDGALELSERGRTVREVVEADTDRYFYAPWDCLDSEETLELKVLLGKLRDGLIAADAERQDR